MRKITSFELKKIISRIGIYLLVLFLAGLLVASVFIYSPTERTDPSLTLSGNTVSEMFNYFTESEIKSNYDTIIEEVANKASTYVVNSPDYNKANNKEYINSLFTSFDNLAMNYYNSVNISNDEYNILLVGINDALDTLQTELDAVLNTTKSGESYYVLVTKSNYDRLYDVLIKVKSNFTSPNNHYTAGSNYYNEYRTELNDCLNALIYPNLSTQASKFYKDGGYYSVITNRLDEIYQKIEAEVQKVNDNPELETDSNIKTTLNELFNRYVNAVNVYKTAFESTICTEALNSVKSNLTRSELLGYGDVSLYNEEQKVVEYTYYIEHNCSPIDFCDAFSVTHTSNYKTNAYDFTFFIMSIYAIVVIVFAIYLSAHTISGEINNHTMRFTAIRPVKRGSIFFGKFMAIMIISFILLLFGAVASFSVGTVLYGVKSANVLMIINNEFILVAHPIAVLALFLLSLLLLIAFYSAITMMLSSFIKSDLLVMLISVVFYFTNLILPLFFGANSWLKFYPFTNMNIFAYFGANRVTNDSLMAKLFNNIVYHGMNLWISMIYVIGFTIILLLIGKTVFRKRDL